MEGWQNVVGQLVQLGLPTLGGLVGNLIVPGLGGAAGSAAGKVAAGAIAGALGVEAKPEAVSAAIQQDPQGAAQKLAQIEAQSKDLAAYLADVADARSTTVQLAKAGSNIAWGAPVVSVIIGVGFFSVMIMLFFVRAEMPSSVFQLLSILFGVLATLFTQVGNYWLGSSEGSRRNADTIRQVAQSAVTPPPGIVAAQVAQAAKR